jgi:hypothetical protein
MPIQQTCVLQSLPGEDTSGYARREEVGVARTIQSPCDASHSPMRKRTLKERAVPRPDYHLFMQRTQRIIAAFRAAHTLGTYAPEIVQRSSTKKRLMRKDLGATCKVVTERGANGSSPQAVKNSNGIRCASGAECRIC